MTKSVIMDGWFKFIKTLTEFILIKYKTESNLMNSFDRISINSAILMDNQNHTDIQLIEFIKINNVDFKLSHMKCT